MRAPLMITTAAALLAACSPPAERPAEPPAAPPAAIVCNELAPDASRQVQIEDELAVAAAASDLRGGAIAPGLYALARAQRINAATGWSGTRAAVLEVSEAADGAVTFNWASAAPGEPRDSWTADFSETPQPQLTYTCGRIGAIDAAFSVEPGALTLRLQDGAAGQLLLRFERRD